MMTHASQDLSLTAKFLVMFSTPSIKSASHSKMAIWISHDILVAFLLLPDYCSAYNSTMVFPTRPKVTAEY